MTAAEGAGAWPRRDEVTGVVDDHRVAVLERETSEASAGSLRLHGQRVLVCAWDYAPRSQGGAEHQARLQAEALAARGCDVTVVCPRYPGTRSQSLHGVRVRRLPMIGRRPFKQASYLLSLLAWLTLTARRFDRIFVHFAYLQADIVVVAACLSHRPVWVRPAASGPQGDIRRMRHVARLTRHVGLRRATWVQAISDSIAGEALSIGVRPESLLRIGNGVDTRRFLPATADTRAELRARLLLPVDAVIVLFVGRLSEQKGLPHLVRAWQRARPAGAHLVLVGGETTIDAVRIPELPDCTVRPWTPRIDDYYRSADVFVLPSIMEGMSNALLEAMSCGLAAVATRVGAAEAMIVDGSSGLLVPPGDEGALGDALQRLVNDPATRARLGAAAATAVAARYSLDRVMDTITGHAWGEVPR